MIYRRYDICRKPYSDPEDGRHEMISQHSTIIQPKFAREEIPCHDTHPQHCLISGCSLAVTEPTERRCKMSNEPKTKLKTMTEPQRRSAAKLIRAECCNCMSGECILLNCVCPQLQSYSLICKWFPEAVLPLDKPLCAEIMGVGKNMKNCAVCMKPFVASSNRAKYCLECATKQRNKHKAARMREYRAG